MFTDAGSTVVQKRMSFLSVTVLSVAFVTMTLILSLTGVTLYGMRVIDKKTDNLTGLVQETFKALPAVREALPPALADALNDERHPEYLENVAISARMVEDQRDTRWPRNRVIVEVQNKGDQTITLLSMRLVGLDASGDPVMERHTWVATPLQLDDEWRGPLLPHETRRFAVWCHSSESPAKVTQEVTELRLWLKDVAQGSKEHAKQPQETRSADAT